MERMLEKFKRRQKAKKDVLKNVMQLVEPNKGKTVTLQMVLSDYKLWWYKKRIIMLAKVYGAEVTLCYKKQTATFVFGSSAMASWFREGFTK